jgi:hypothetical protein
VRVTERGEIPQLPAKAGIRWGKWIHSPSFQPKQAGGGGFAQLPAKTAGGGWEISPSFQPKQAGGGGLCLFASSEWQTQRECTANTPASSKDSRRATPAGGGGGSYNPSHSSFGNVAGDSQPIHAANVAATLAGDSQPQSQPQLIWQCSSSCGIVAAKGASL